MEWALVEKCQKHPFVLDIFRDRSGAEGLSILVDGFHHFVLAEKPGDLVKYLRMVCFTSTHVYTWDVRKLLKHGVLPPWCFDAKLLYGGEDNLFRVAKQELGEEQTLALRQTDRKLTAHLRACKTAKVDLDRHSILRLVPSKLMQTLLRCRAMAIHQLVEKKVQNDPEAIQRYHEDLFPFAVCLYHVENNKIKLDLDVVKAELKKEHTPAVAKFFRSMEGLADKEGYVQSRFNPCGGKTGRIKVESGFNCMGIPHGPPRQAVVSRFTGGRIVTFDFNAIDYRCLVQSITDEEFRLKYKDCPDFHSRTTSFLFGNQVNDLRRQVIKAITYVYLYGGSEDTLVQKTRLSSAKVKDILSRLDIHLRPLRELCKTLYLRSVEQGYVELPMGRRIPLEKGDHEGKVLGLYAQGFSSWVFEQAFRAAFLKTMDWKSKIIFTVHDELVMDFHPLELGKVDEVKEAMEKATSEFEFTIKIKTGRSYGEATD